MVSTFQLTRITRLMATRACDVQARKKESKALIQVAEEQKKQLEQTNSALIERGRDDQGQR